MALIIDPDYLNDGTEIVINTSTKTIRLVKTGNLSDDGVTLKCVYSKLKELWKSDATYIKFPFPLVPITDEQFDMVYGWDWYDDTTRYLIRSGGWALKDASGNSLEEWACIETLGDLTGQAYYQQSSNGPAVNFQLTGKINQAIKIYGDATHGNFDYRGYLRLFCRNWGYIYAYTDASNYGAIPLTYKKYPLPLNNTVDPKITHTEGYVNNNEPYTGMSITWYNTAQQRNIGGTNYNFHVIIDGNGGTAEQIYEFVQAQLRKDTDIDSGSGTKIGKVTLSILHFIGDKLYTNYFPDTPSGGTFIDGYQSADINRLVFVDDSQTERTFPYVAVLRINFGDNLKNDSQAKFWVFFTDTPNGDYGTENAIIVNTASSVKTATRARSSNVATITTQDPHGLAVGDAVTVTGVGGTGYNGQWVVKTVPNSTTFTYDNTGSNESQTSDTGGTVYRAMSGFVNGQSSIQLTFDYDGNTQGGRTAGQNADITAVAIGLSTAQFVTATGVIEKSIANTVTLTAPLERNYSNI